MKYYSREHEWVEINDEEEAVVGITAYLADKVGDISYVELPKEGCDVIVGDVISMVESLKNTHNVVSPVSGTVVAVNTILDDDPGMINAHPGTKGWIYRLENIDFEELDELMDEAAYAKYLKTLK